MTLELRTPTAPVADYADYRAAKFRMIASSLEISPAFASALRQLEGFDIVVIADDSGSMNTPVKVPGGDPYGRPVTRWDELRGYVTNVTSIAIAMDPDGIDLYFLNRPGITSVSAPEQIQAAFVNPPSGFTPLTATFQQVLATKAAVLRERKLLVLIATDGMPTDRAGNVDKESFFKVLRGRPANCYVSIIACTDDDASVGYLNQLDKEVPGLDVIDDYESEKREVRKAQGPNFPFSFGDYTVKTMLGPVDSRFDALDEQKVKVGSGGVPLVPTSASATCCCLM